MKLGVHILALVAAVSALGAAADDPALSFVSASIEAERTNVFVNEVFPVDLALACEGVSIDSGMQIQDLPDESRMRFGPFEELPIERRVEGGTVRELRRFRSRARAVAEGTLTLAPVLRVRMLTRDPFKPAAELVGAPRDIPVRPLAVRVDPLPADGRPDHFSGAVGHYAMTAGVSPTNVFPGDLVTLEAAITGEGYWDESWMPRLPPAPHFKVYEPELASSQPAAGRWVFRQTLVPMGEEAVEIPPLAWSWFDPRRGAYETLTAGPFRLAVRPLPEGAAPVVAEIVNESGAGREPAAGWRRLVDVSSKGPALLTLFAVLTAAWSAGGCQNRWVRRLVRLVLLAGWLLAQGVRGFQIPDRAEAITGRAAKARFAPQDGALTLFEVPQGQTVRVLQRWHGWARVRAGALTGWMPADALTRPPAAPHGGAGE